MTPLTLRSMAFPSIEYVVDISLVGVMSLPANCHGPARSSLPIAAAGWALSAELDDSAGAETASSGAAPHPATTETSSSPRNEVVIARRKVIVVLLAASPAA